MAFLSEIPAWLGSAAATTLGATLGYFGKGVQEWWKKRHESKRHRRARLEQLSRLLDESRNLYRSQRSQAQRLLEGIAASNPTAIEPGLSINQVFARAYSSLSPEQREIHAIIRGVTATSLKRVNLDMASWLRNDDWFKSSTHVSEQLRRLSERLQELEVHLNEWDARFVSVFEKQEAEALNYLADEKKQGTGFPIGIEALVRQVLSDA